MGGKKRSSKSLVRSVHPLHHNASLVKNPANSLSKPVKTGLSEFLAKLTRKMQPGKARQAWPWPSFLGNLGHKTPALLAMLVPFEGLGGKRA